MKGHIKSKLLCHLFLDMPTPTKSRWQKWHSHFFLATFSPSFPLLHLFFKNKLFSFPVIHHLNHGFLFYSVFSPFFSDTLIKASAATITTCPFFLTQHFPSPFVSFPPKVNPSMKHLIISTKYVK